MTTAKAASDTALPGNGRITALVASALALACFAAYLPALHGAFVWDDVDHVTAEPLRNLHGLWRIWFDLGATQQYYPLLHSAFWLEHALWGDAVLGYHVVNVALHALSATLVFVVLRRLAVPGAALAAFVFALHPVMVESVAWISELKNTLSAALYLCALLAWLAFDERRGTGRYLVASGLFACAVATKTVTATLPAAILVIAWWRSGRIRTRRDVLPLVPWFALGVAGGLVTAWVEKTLIGAQGEGYVLSLAQRVLVAGRVVWFYAGKLAWPANLSFIYPRWQVDASVAWQWAFPAALVLLLGALLLHSRRRDTRGGRAPLAATLFFVGTLFPALGFVNVYPFVFSFVADHFQYLASLGPISLACAGAAVLAARLPPRARGGTMAAAALLLAGLSMLTWRQAATYRDPRVLYRATIERNPTCWMALNNLAVLQADDRDYAGAVASLEAALASGRDDRPLEHVNIGRVLAAIGRQDDAVAHYRRAQELRPDLPQVPSLLAKALDQRGLQLAAAGRNDEALDHFEAAVRSDATNASARCDLGLALLRAGRAGEAAAQFEAALALRPDYPEALNNLAWVLATDPVLCDPERAMRLAWLAVLHGGGMAPPFVDTLAEADAARIP